MHVPSRALWLIISSVLSSPAIVQGAQKDHPPAHDFMLYREEERGPGSPYRPDALTYDIFNAGAKAIAGEKRRTLVTDRTPRPRPSRLHLQQQSASSSLPACSPASFNIPAAPSSRASSAQRQALKEFADASNLLPVAEERGGAIPSNASPPDATNAHTPLLTGMQPNAPAAHTEAAAPISSRTINFMTTQASQSGSPDRSHVTCFSCFVWLLRKR